MRDGSGGMRVEGRGERQTKRNINDILQGNHLEVIWNKGQ